jgi:methionine aminopeptidase
MRTELIYCPSEPHHRPPAGHPEHSGRLEAVLAGAGHLNAARIDHDVPASREDLLRVHDRDHVDRVFASAPEEGLVPLDADTWMSLGSLHAALCASGVHVVKSPAEIVLVRRAAELAGHALLESMRSTRPGIYEYELDAVAKYLFFRHGAQAEAYRSLVATGTNAFHPHYHAGTGRLQEGELVLMDYSPDIGYYASDVTRMWPVSGRWEGWQRELYGFYLAVYEAILVRITPGATAAEVNRGAGEEAERLLAGTSFSEERYERAARALVDALHQGGEDPEAGLSVSHYVGMGTHDVGGRVSGPFEPGMVFVIEPALVVPEDSIYIRLEDPILVNETGAESLIDFVPRGMDEIEAVMREEGLLQRYPRLPVTEPLGTQSDGDGP